MAIIAVAAAGLLAAFPVPPQRAAEEAGFAQQDVSAGLPDADDLVLADTIGDAVVGLTLRPGGHGPNDAFVYLLGADGPEAASDLEASLSVNGERTHPLERCGPACRRMTVDVRCGDAIHVHVAGHDDPAMSTVLDSPAPSAEQLIDRMTAAMNGLTALRYDEVFGPVDPPIRLDCRGGGARPVPLQHAYHRPGGHPHRRDDLPGERAKAPGSAATHVRSRSPATSGSTRTNLPPE